MKQYEASRLMHSDGDVPSALETQSWLEPTGVSPLWPVEYSRVPSQLQTTEIQQEPVLIRVR